MSHNVVEFYKGTRTNVSRGREVEDRGLLTKECDSKTEKVLKFIFLNTSQNKNRKK